LIIRTQTHQHALPPCYRSFALYILRCDLKICPHAGPREPTAETSRSRGILKPGIATHAVVGTCRPDMHGNTPACGFVTAIWRAHERTCERGSRDAYFGIISRAVYARVMGEKFKPYGARARALLIRDCRSTREPSREDLGENPDNCVEVREVVRLRNVVCHFTYFAVIHRARRSPRDSASSRESTVT